MIEFVDRIETHNTLGECVLWNDRQQSIWWTDIHEARLYRYQLQQRQLTTYTLPERLASFGFTDADDWLICAFASGFALYQPHSQKIDWIAQPEKEIAGTRFNDGRVDRQGRFWAGTMCERQPMEAAGGLYCLAGRNVKKVIGDIYIANSICWSPDSSHFFFADSPRHRIQRYDFDPATGTPQQPQIFSTTTPPQEPDGSTVDADGNVWNAVWGGSKVVRHSKNGGEAMELTLPVSQPTCVAFGGPELNLLLISTAKIGLSPEQLDREPDAGNLLIYQTSYRGLPESRFKI